MEIATGTDADGWATMGRHAQPRVRIVAEKTVGIFIICGCTKIDVKQKCSAPGCVFAN